MLYKDTLGADWDRLAPAIQQLHSVTNESVFVGRCVVERGHGFLARLASALYGFPQAGTDQPVQVTLRVIGTAPMQGESWIRTIGGRRFSSTQFPGRNGSGKVIRERFGPISLDLALSVEGANLRYTVHRWRMFGITLPMLLGPRGGALETIRDGQFRFEVEISHALTGLVVRYCGELRATSVQPR